MLRRSQVTIDERLNISSHESDCSVDDEVTDWKVALAGPHQLVQVINFLGASQPFFSERCKVALEMQSTVATSLTDMNGLVRAGGDSSSLSIYSEASGAAGEDQGSQDGRLCRQIENQRKCRRKVFGGSGGLSLLSQLRNLKLDCIQHCCPPWLLD